MGDADNDSEQQLIARVVDDESEFIPCPWEDRIVKLDPFLLTVSEKDWLGSCVTHRCMTLDAMVERFGLSKASLKRYASNFRKGTQTSKRRGRPLYVGSKEEDELKAFFQSMDPQSIDPRSLTIDDVKPKLVELVGEKAEHMSRWTFKRIKQRLGIQPIRGNKRRRKNDSAEANIFSGVTESGLSVARDYGWPQYDHI